METSIFVTDLAQQLSLSVVGHSHPVVVLFGPEQAGADCLSLQKPTCPTWCRVFVSRAKSML